MFCKTCGADLVEGSNVCVVCGTENAVTPPTSPVQPTFVPPAQPIQPTQSSYIPPVQTTYNQPIQPPAIPKIISIQEPVTPHNEYVTFGEAIKLFFANYFNFRGRASKSEYWWVQLFYILTGVGGGTLLFLVAVFTAGEGVGSFFLVLIALYMYMLAMSIPLLSLQIRRLHDIGKPWFWIFLGEVILMFLSLKGSEGDNAWGPGPVSKRRF